MTKRAGPVARPSDAILGSLEAFAILGRAAGFTYYLMAQRFGPALAPGGARGTGRFAEGLGNGLAADGEAGEGLAHK